MAQLENAMLIILGVLIVCLIASVSLFQPNGNSVGAFGYKCMKGALGPNSGYCLKVDEAPNKATGVYSNAVACIEECSRKSHPSGQFGYKCMKGSLGPDTGYCLKVDEAPNKATGVYSNADACIEECTRKTGLIHNYERNVNSGVCECRETMKSVDEKNGVFNTKTACNATCAY